MTDEPQLKYADARLVDCRALDDFAAIYLGPYGKTWRSLDTGSDGYHNGSYVEADVTVGAVIEDDEDQSFGRWLLNDGPFYLPEEESYADELPGIQHILQWLCNKGKIAEGKYVVELWW